MAGSDKYRFRLFAPAGTKPVSGLCHMRCGRNHGFALVVTLSLMILLTLIAVGMLSLSAITLRSASGQSALAEARASARLALMLALNQLQMELGPDQRISTAADQVAGTASTPQANPRVWTAVYKAWQAPPNPTDADPRPSPVFRRWLVSGTDAQQQALATASSTLTPANSVELVGKGTLGTASTSGRVAVPFLDQKTGSATTSRIAWWIGDQGVKAAIATPLAELPGTDRRLVRNGLQGAPRNVFQIAKTAALEPFKNLAPDDARIQLVNDWKQAEFLSDTPEGPRPLFHDLAANTSGLLTNVRSGGFRKDLSMYLESSTPPVSFPAPIISPDGSLYQVKGQDGIRIDELWSHYNLYKQLQTTSISFTTGGSAGGAANPHLKSAGTLTEAQADNFFFYKRPVIISYKALFSFYITDTNPRKLAVCVDPIVTFWNPYDVPVSLGAAWNSIRFHKIPYSINSLKVDVETGGVTTTVGTYTINLGGRASSSFAANDYNYGTLICGKAPDNVVLKPGEVMVYSQGPNTAPAVGNRDVVKVLGKPGFNFGGGIYFPLKDIATGAEIKLPTTPISRVILSFTGITPNSENVRQGAGGWNPSDPPISVTHFETYLFDADANGRGIGGAFVDFWRGIHPFTSPKPAAQRFLAKDKGQVFKSLSARSGLDVAGSGTATDRKTYFMLYACDAKTEEDSLRSGQFSSRLNPSASYVDFADLSEQELDLVPFEMHIQPITGKNAKFDVTIAGQGFFGGGLISGNGSSFVTTHSVPREPIVSLARLQFSMANGFNRVKPDQAGAYYSSGPTNQSIRLPLLPQICHAIGNSQATGVLAKDQTEGMLAARPLADHSYLANKALWDDWFFSGIAPGDVGPNATGLSQKSLADGFLKSAKKLPVARYRPNLGGAAASDVLIRLFDATAPKAEATALTASYLSVDGMFNVNSTSVEAWKAVLAGLKNHPAMVRNDNGSESIIATTDSSPVAGLIAPTTDDANGANIDVKDLAQWTGRRTLNDEQIEELAKVLVVEVRKRGPFLSLADFINRRPGSDESLARAGALQSAIDAAKLNVGYDARMAGASPSLAFSAAESAYPAAMGAPGIIKQADILTPIAPILSARSDSFIIRTYGEKRDSSGTKVLARAWCEAVVERDKHFVDSSDAPETPFGSLKPVNQTFGRRMVVRSFRWLNPADI